MGDVLQGFPIPTHSLSEAASAGEVMFYAGVVPSLHDLPYKIVWLWDDPCCVLLGLLLAMDNYRHFFATSPPFALHQLPSNRPGLATYCDCEFTKNVQL